MKRILAFCAVLAAFTGLAMAADFNGKLIDASCADQMKNQTNPNAPQATCNPTASTTAYALVVGTTTYKLDSEGNSKAAQAMKSHADRTNPNSPNNEKMQGAPVMAKVTGTASGSELKVETVEIQ